jgi:hypothetical protein
MKYLEEFLMWSAFSNHRIPLSEVKYKYLIMGFSPNKTPCSTYLKITILSL